MTDHTKRRLIFGLPAALAAPLILTACGGDPNADEDEFDNAPALKRGDDPTITRGPTQKPLIALTFDDGPHPTLTPRLLDILDDKNVRATFYLLGSRVARHPELAKRIRRDGHEIGNHTWSHPNLANRSDTTLLSELERTTEVIQKATGKRPRTMRPPYGSLTMRQRRLVNSKLRMPTVMWSIDSLDYTGSSSTTITNRILRHHRIKGQ